MKKTTVKKTVVKFLMRIVFAVLLLIAIPASDNSTTITGHAAAKAVKPTAVKKITKVKTTKNSISVKWPKSQNATGYQIRAYKNSRLVKKSSVKAVKATIEGLSANTAYKISVRAYRKSGKNTAYSTWKSVSIKTAKVGASIAKPANVETVLNAEVTESSIRVVWPTPMNATGYPTGYQIRTYKGASLVNEATTKKTEITIKKLKDGTTYKIKVRSYRKSGNSIAYGAWKSVSIKTAEAQKKLTDKEVAAVGKISGTDLIDIEFDADGHSFSWVYGGIQKDELNAKWKKSMDQSKIKWTVSDSSKAKLRQCYDYKGSVYNLSAVVVPLKPGTVTVTLTYAGYKVDSREVTLCYPPSDWAYWEPGAYYNRQRFPLIKEYNEWINNWVAENITDGMSEYEKAKKAADHVRTCMLYDEKDPEGRAYKDMLGNWKEGLGVCGDAAAILDCFLRKLQINTCVIVVSMYEPNDHARNWAKLDGKTYEVDATFWDNDAKADYEKDPILNKSYSEAWIAPTDLPKPTK